MENTLTPNTLRTPASGQGRKRYADIPLSEKISAITLWLDEHKAQRVVSLNLAGQSGFADAMLVCSAGSVRHAQSLADGVSALCHERNFEYLRMEGYEAGQWILVDLNDIIIHVFLEPVRELYRLEELWERVPARDTPSVPGNTGEVTA
ncbi:MAG: ribosome silencing factor [Desulfovibrionaceae bacterium]|nr:ribosome silencing factor [Desulfovibrionaceae bacterium]